MTTNTFLEITERVLVPTTIPIIIGLITFRIAKKQINNTGITQFRQQWINSLRDTLSRFISKAEYIFITEDDDKVDEAYREMVEAQYKIELLLNPEEADHNNVTNLLEKIRNIVFEEKIDEDTFDKNISQLLKESKKVLKREWIVVKKGK